MKRSSPRTALVFRTATAVLALALGAACASAAETVDGPPGRLVVSGTAEVHVAPDRATFAVGVTRRGRVAGEVAEATARAGRALVEALRGAEVAIERLTTHGPHLSPEFSPRPRDADPDWTPSIAGYTGSLRVEVVSADLAGVGALLGAAVDAGANLSDGVRFSLEDDAAARETAIEQATANALREARVLAGAAGVTPGAVIELRLDHAHTDAPMLRMAAASGRSEARFDAAPPVEPGEVTVRASVSVTLALQ